MAKREIACTAIGRNALVSGLICHVAALIAGMMSAPGVNQLIIYFYLFSCILLIGGGYAEFKHRSPALVKNGKFCLSAAATLFPLIGPMAALFLIYRTPVEGNDAGSLGGFLIAFLKLRANTLLIFALILLLFAAYIVTRKQEDPYFKRRAPGSASMQWNACVNPAISDYRSGGILSC